MEKTGEKKREEETWWEKREAAARVRALMEKDMRAKAAEKSMEVEGEEKKEARMEGGCGEEPKWHISEYVSLPREANTPKQRTWQPDI